MKEKIHPSKVVAYNHKKIDGEKPVASNLYFKQLYESRNIESIKSAMIEFAFDDTQKNLLKTVLNEEI